MRHSPSVATRVLVLALTLAVPVSTLAQAPTSSASAAGRAASARHEASLGRKADAGGPSGDLAGDVSREQAEEEDLGPSLGYDIFRFGVELQLKDKRLDLMRTLQEMVSIGAEPKEQPGLIFRLAELNWEESRYWFFESHRQEEKSLACKEQNDQACVATALAEKEANEKQSEMFQQQAIGRYKELIQKHPDYERVDEVLFYLGHNLWEAGKEQEALAAYKSLIERFPNSSYVPDAYLAYGEWYFNNSDGDRKMLSKALEAYGKAASYTESRVYGFAVYKQGWCLYNLGRYAEAADKFKATVFYGELTQNVANTNKTALIREARKDYVLAYSHFGDPTEARAAFMQVGGKEEFWSMWVGLAGLYYDTGKDKEAVLVYRQLIREQPLSPDAPLFQSRIVSAVMRIGNKRITVEQARLLVKIFNEVEASGVIRDDADRRKLAQARELSERTLSNLAVVWHNEGKKTRDEETFEFSSAVYTDYLSLFPDSPKAYDLRFFHSELLFEHLHKYDWAAAEYDRVAAADIAAIDESKRLEAEGQHEEAAASKPGKWMVQALEGSIFSRDEMVKKLGDDLAAAAGDHKQPLPIPVERQALLDACDRYLTWVPDGDKRVEIQYKASQIRYRYNHFDEAVEGFSSIALEHPSHELAVFSAHLVLDTFNLLEDYERLDQWAKRFYDEPRLAKGKFRTELLEIIERNSFKLVALLEKEERFAEAGDRYLRFVSDYPRSDLADRALFNAAIDYARAGRPEQAISVRERMVREYPKSDLVPEALFRNAAMMEEKADFAKAAAQYETYAKAWEKQTAPSRSRRRGAKPVAAGGPKYEESKARIALTNATVFRNALGQRKLALRNQEKYLELWPRDPDVEKIQLAIVDLQQQTGNNRLAMRGLEAWQKQYGRNIEKNLIALYKMAQLHEARGSKWPMAQKYEEILEQWRITPRARKAEIAGKQGLAIEGVAVAHFAKSAADWTAYNRIRIRLPQDAMARALQDKGQRLLDLQKYYTETVALGVAGPGICALQRIGEAYHGFAQALYDAPVPRGFTDEQEGLYKMALAEQAMPVEMKAREAFAATVAKSRELGMHNGCSDQALKTLEQIAAHEFQKLTEEPASIRIPHVSAGGGLLTEVQPEAPILQDAEAQVPDVVNQQAPRAAVPTVREGAKEGGGNRGSVRSGAEEPPLPSRFDGEPDDSDLLP